MKNVKTNYTFSTKRLLSSLTHLCEQDKKLLFTFLFGEKFKCIGKSDINECMKCIIIIYLQKGQFCHAHHFLYFGLCTFSIAMEKLQGERKNCENSSATKYCGSAFHHLRELNSIDKNIFMLNTHF